MLSGTPSLWPRPEEVRPAAPASRRRRSAIRASSRAARRASASGSSFVPNDFFRIRGRPVSRTLPPPRVSTGEGRRRMKRSPGRAGRDDSRTSWAKRVGTGGQFFRLGPAGAGDEMDLSGDVGRAVMDADAGAVGERRGDLGKEGRLDREERRGAKSVLRHERLPAPELGPLDPREVQARPLSGEGLAALLAMDLDAPDAHLAPVRKKRQPVVDRDPPAVERPGHDGAEALHREGAVEEEARGAAVPGRPVEAPRRLGERALQFRNPRSRHGRDGEDGSLFEERPLHEVRGSPPRRRRRSRRRRGRSSSARSPRSSRRARRESRDARASGA